METLILIFLFAAGITFAINLGYRFLANQGDARSVKARINELNSKMREEQKKGNKAEVSRLLGETMRENGKLMRMNMKPMLMSVIIVLFTLPAIGNLYNDVIIAPGEAFSAGSNSADVALSGNMLSIADASCELPCRLNLFGSQWSVSMQGDKIKFSRIVALLPVALPIVGNILGWLGWYFLSFMLLTILFRRAMKIVA